MSQEINEATPLLKPANGTPPIIASEAAFASAIQELSQGNGPFALDAERASGFRYSARAYLIQIKRAKGGLHLIDPIAFGVGHPLFAQLNEVLSKDEVILHASTQDLPCLREIGIHPTKLFDTELGARIAGLPRVGLGALLESLLGVSLSKEHSASNWSTRPLPENWLTYAALDVELLIELREKIYQLLFDSKKLAWAQEEFASILKAPPAKPRVDPWRRTSGAHKVKKREELAIVKALWIARDSLASREDIASGKLLNDLAIIELALTAPTNRKSMEKVLRPIGARARWLENTTVWLAEIAAAVALPQDQWPSMRSNLDSLPPVKLWRDKFPEKYAPLTHARFAIEEKSRELNIPFENLITPEIVRRICWSPPPLSTATLDEEGVHSALLALGARRWQGDVAAPLIALALLERQARVEPEIVAELTPEESCLPTTPSKTSAE